MEDARSESYSSPSSFASVASWDDANVSSEPRVTSDGADSEATVASCSEPSILEWRILFAEEEEDSEKESAST